MIGWWLLVVGCWLLVVSYWSSVFGLRSLVFGFNFRTSNTSIQHPDNYRDNASTNEQ